MKNDVTIFGIVLNLPIVAIIGNLQIISYIQKIKQELEVSIPGFKLVDNKNNLKVTWFLNIKESKTSNAFYKIDDNVIYLELEGELELITVNIWIDLFKNIASYSLLNAGLFLIDASINLINNKAIMFCGWPGSGKAAAAYQLSSQGYPIISSKTCLVDKDFNVIVGTQKIQLTQHCIKKYFQEIDNKSNSSKLTDYISVRENNKSIKQNRDYQSKKEKIISIYHLRIQDKTVGVTEISQYRKRLVISSHVISRQVCRPIIIGPWEIVLLLNNNIINYSSLQKIINAMANIQQYQLYSNPKDLKTIIENTNEKYC